MQLVRSTSDDLAGFECFFVYKDLQGNIRRPLKSDRTCFPIKMLSNHMLLC